MAESVKEAKVSSREKYEFEKQVRLLKQFRGRGTELISIYIPDGYAIHEVTNKLREEFGQASNIKSKTTQKNVQGAIEKILSYLKTFKAAPKNGIAVFCGNVSQVEGKTDLRLYSIVPPAPFVVQFYRCESKFILDPLEELITQSGSYGFVVMDGHDATIALLTGKKFKIFKNVHTTAFSKFHVGGQSAARFQRLREEQVELYYTRVGEAMSIFLEVPHFKGVIVAGPGPVKDTFLQRKTFNYQLKILGVVDTNYTDEQGLKEALEGAEEVFAEQEAMVEKRLVADFMQKAVKGSGVAYGYKDILEALEQKRVEALLISEGTSYSEFKLKCSQCGKEVVRVSKLPIEEFEATLPPCSCGGKMQVIDQKNLSADLITKAEDQEIRIEMISTDTSEGAEFLGSFYGMGAFLRY